MHKYQKVAIIIVNYNNAQDTLECLESLQNIDYPNVEIFLMDNGSTDDSVEKMGKFVSSHYRYKLKTHFYKLESNLGFAGGNNRGIHYALSEGADYILLLNNDTISLSPNFLTKLVEAANLNKQIGIVGPKIYYYHPNEKRQYIWYNGGGIVWPKGGVHYYQGRLDNFCQEKYFKKTQYVTGCALLIKKGVIEKIGLLSEDFFMYYEDADWCLRATEAGYQCIVTCDALLWHKVSRSTVKFGKPKLHYYDTRNLLMLAKRHASLFILIYMYTWSIYQYLKQLIKITISPSKRPISKMIMKGIEDFYKGKTGDI